MTGKSGVKIIWLRLDKHLAEIRQASGRDRPLKDFEPLEYIVLYPKVPDDSEINIGEYPVQVVGLSKFRAALIMQTGRASPAFTQDELQAIPTLLKLTQWHIEPSMESSVETRETELSTPDASGKTTKVLDRNDFLRPTVRMLVARAHEFSQPVFHLDRDCVVVGRDPGNDLVINHESVSRKHARSGEKTSDGSCETCKVKMAPLSVIQATPAWNGVWIATTRSRMVRLCALAMRPIPSCWMNHANEQM